MAKEDVKLLKYLKVFPIDVREKAICIREFSIQIRICKEASIKETRLSKKA